MTEDANIEILLVDDSEADVRFALEALKEAKVKNKVHVVYDGESALEFLRRPGQRRPDLMLLDLNLPGLDGREVLADIKQDPLLAVMPVVILTTSRAEEDVLRTYALHANCYITKPVDLAQFVKVIQSIDAFWFSVVKLPPPPKQG
ncbi:MAG: response regulator [Archangiaceae bacterium]|nr:response regulator [Archangiaceae bacterium]